MLISLVVDIHIDSISIIYISGNRSG